MDSGRVAWRGLAVAYVAGEDGLEDAYGEYGGIGWPTWRVIHL